MNQRSTPSPIQVEIPVTDIQRAKQFYSEVFGFIFQADTPTSRDAGLTTFEDPVQGFRGQLIQSRTHSPSKDKVAFYFKTYDIDTIVDRLGSSQGRLLNPKHIEDGLRHIATELEDSEGNRIAVHQIYPSK